MKKILYRIIVNNIVPERTEAFVQILENEFNFSREKADDFAGSLPRILYESHNGNNVKKKLNIVKPANANLRIEKLIKGENFPFYIEASKQQLLSKLLNMTLRSGTDLAFVYVVAEPGDGACLHGSLMGREKEIGNSFRLSDFVFIIDEKSLLFLGFATDHDGLKYLIPKLTKVVKNIVGKGAFIKAGEAAVPKDGYTLSDIMGSVNKNLGLDQKEAASVKTSDSKPFGEKRDTIATRMNTPALAPFHQHAYFKEENGVFFYKLLNLSPETVWSGVKNMSIKDQKRFLSRIPHTLKLVDYLSEKIKSQAEVRDLETAQTEISKLVTGMQIEKDLIERQGNRTLVMSMLNQIESLPVIPSVAMQVYQLSIDPESKIEDVQRVLSTDQGLALRILKIVNSPFYGLSKKVDSIREGIVILGMEEIAQMAFGLSLAGSFSPIGIEDTIDPEAFRRHTVEVAVIGRYLCEKLDKELFKGAFTACVLHDIGKLFLIQHFPDLYKRVVFRGREMQMPIHAAEEDIFGLNHGIVGGIITKKWNLPASLVQAISFHHYPFDAFGHQELAAMVGFADYLSHVHDADSHAEENMMAGVMNQGHIDVLHTTLGNMSTEVIADKKIQVLAFLQEVGVMFSSIANA